MNVLALDAATAMTAVALRCEGGYAGEAHEGLGPGGRPRHAQRLLALAAELLGAAAIDWSEIDVVALGVGPGSYTGLRIAAATARGLARAHDARLVGVSSLRALAEPFGAAPVAAVIDARRGEAFVAVHRDGEEVLPPAVCGPSQLGALAQRGGPGTLAVGDGALRFASELESAGVPLALEAERHRISAASICRLALAGKLTAAVPDYLRRADAERALGNPVR